MKRLNIISVLALLAVVVFSTDDARAQESAATWSCDAKTNTLVIRYTDDFSQVEAQWPKQPRPIRFMSLLVTSRSIVKETRSRTVTCQLKSERFEVIFEPGVPNPNLLGRCGGAVTGIVTVKRNGVVVLDEQEFEDLNCHARERMLERITFKGVSSKPQLTYVRYK